MGFVVPKVRGPPLIKEKHQSFEAKQTQAEAGGQYLWFELELAFFGVSLLTNINKKPWLKTLKKRRKMSPRKRGNAPLHNKCLRKFWGRKFENSFLLRSLCVRKKKWCQPASQPACQSLTGFASATLLNTIV